MVNVCAWCERFLGLKAPIEDSTVTHGICKSCFARQTWDDMPVLVVTPEQEHLVPVLSDMLRGVPEIRVVVERRGGRRRSGVGTNPGRERRGPDRRQQDPLQLT